eukprot:TRINITY_DN65518_c0_g1_i1.p1 TRINITY_DN65518_c0_g1~~TRINITY_DN65518_c0_g1_i1.p1  ORF type:complete len:897 (+),score=317.49 TRINITY_DN65518_c0_g1_i1:83-2692(+)
MPPKVPRGRSRSQRSEAPSDARSVAPAPALPVSTPRQAGASGSRSVTGRASSGWTPGVQSRAPQRGVPTPRTARDSAYDYLDPFQAQSMRSSAPGSQATSRSGGAPQGQPVDRTDQGLEVPEDQALLVWGTSVVTDEVRSSFSDFLTQYTTGEERSATQPYYLEQLNMVFLNSRDILDVDLTHLQSFDEKLFGELCRFPEEILCLMNDAANLVYNQHCPTLDEQEGERSTIRVRPFNLPELNRMRELGPEALSSLVSLKGMVVRVSRLMPEMQSAIFECRECCAQVSVEEERNTIAEPTRCTNCGAAVSFLIQHQLCQFRDKQLVRVQESPEATPPGQTPCTIQAWMHDELFDSCCPGDRVTLTGIFSTRAVRKGGKQQNAKQVSGVHATYLRCLHVAKAARSNGAAADALEDDEEESPAVREMRDRMMRTAKRADIYEVLTRSLAPSIWGHDDVKLGLLCMLFGGSTKDFEHSATRAELNVLLCGDPGVAKSQLLSAVHGVAPRGIYTSGKGSSSVGLTAYVARDPETGELVLEAGALVLSDQGVACIDEFDKMDDGTRAILHEVMEQQTVSLARSGIICSLNARASVLASANPKESKWNRSMNILENINIGPTLLSRFDLVWLLLDEQNADLDRRLAGFLTQMITAEEGAKYAEDKRTGRQVAAAEQGVSGDDRDLTIGPMDSARMAPADLSRYIAHCRRCCRPTLTEESQSCMIRAYLQLRKARGSKNVVTATVRQLEGMIRISEALAKMRLAESVEPRDVKEAKRLIEVALKHSIMDPETGMLLTTTADVGHGDSVHNIMRHIEDVIRKERLSGKQISYSELQQKYLEHASRPITQAQLQGAVGKMIDKGTASSAGDIVTFTGKH